MVSKIFNDKLSLDIWSPLLFQLFLFVCANFSVLLQVFSSFNKLESLYFMTVLRKITIFLFVNIEDIVVEMKVRDRGERRKWMEV